MAKRRVIDCSHPIESGMITHPGLPAPMICDFLSREASRARYAEGVEFHIGKIEMVANTGTYIDSPFHRFAEGKDIAGLALDALVDLPCTIVRIPASAPRAITAGAFANADVRGRAVLVHTGWDSKWGQPAYLANNPHLTADAATDLADRGAILVGIDSLNIDSLDDLTRPVHSTLLGRGIPIVEHLCNLASVTNDARFHAAPVAVKGMGTFPVRAFAIEHR